jgi:hypothetical protein
MASPTAASDREVEDLRKRLTALSVEKQAQVLESVLTPGLRLRVLAEQVRRQVGPLSDDEEVDAESDIANAVKQARRSLIRGR